MADIHNNNISSSSIIFQTAGGKKIEVTRAQMESARNRLWRDENDENKKPPGSSNASLPKVKQKDEEENENKENEINFFDEDFFFDDDIYDDLLEANIQKAPPPKRVLEEITLNSEYSGQKKRKTL